MKCKHCGEEIKRGYDFNWYHKGPFNYDLCEVRRTYAEPAEEKEFIKKGMMMFVCTTCRRAYATSEECGRCDHGRWFGDYMKKTPFEDAFNEKSQTERDLESLRCRDVRKLPWHAAVTRLILRLYEKDKC